MSYNEHAREPWLDDQPLAEEREAAREALRRWEDGEDDEDDSKWKFYASISDIEAIGEYELAGLKEIVAADPRNLQEPPK